MDGAIVVLSTTASKDEAKRIALALVEGRLAACVQVVRGIESVYRWKGKVCVESECLLVIKTRESLFERLAERLRSLHSYDVPEIVSLPVLKGTRDYLNWLEESVDSGGTVP